MWRQRKGTSQEIEEAIEAGVENVGENYLRDVKKVYPEIGERVKWHFIGILDKQKHDLFRRKNLLIFDMIETVDSLELAEELARNCKKIGKVMPILIEINSGKEPQKSGVLPENAVELIKKIAVLENVAVQGVMTMGPRMGTPESFRPYFKKTKKVFEQISRYQIPGVEMKYLSMGMTQSYKVAIEEGANIVRIGTKLFENNE